MEAKTSDIREPLARFGRFGLHVIPYPSGRFGFAGTVPIDLGGKSYQTREDAEAAFHEWEKSNKDAG